MGGRLLVRAALMGGSDELVQVLVVVATDLGEGVRCGWCWSCFSGG